MLFKSQIPKNGDHDDGFAILLGLPENLALHPGFKEKRECDEDMGTANHPKPTFFFGPDRLQRSVMINPRSGRVIGGKRLDGFDPAKYGFDRIRNRRDIKESRRDTIAMTKRVFEPTSTPLACVPFSSGDPDLFEEQEIECITTKVEALPDGTLVFHYYDGSIETIGVEEVEADSTEELDEEKEARDIREIFAERTAPPCCAGRRGFRKPPNDHSPDNPETAQDMFLPSSKLIPRGR